MTALNISDWIAQLADNNAAARENAALGIYRYGKALGEAATSAWRANLAFATELTGAAVVGLAVQPARFAAIRAAMGNPPLADVPADQDAAEYELHFQNPAGEAWLDILTSVAPGRGGALDRYLQKFGEGIQQVEFFVRDVRRATTALSEKPGIAPIYPATRPGANGTQVNFFLATTPGEDGGRKVLIELVQI
jgi:hypothetical protein